ncbi:MAG: HD domain-containing protein [Minisyncoccia bacterium]|jgi:hypothetical protein
MKFDEERLIQIAKPYIKKGRAGDWEHAQAAVEWVKKLGAGRDDLNLLISAAYIHDIGWSGIGMGKKLDLNGVLEFGPQANKNSQALVSKVLSSLDFSGSEIETANRLVAAADKHYAEKEDEAIIVDADNLSKLTMEQLREKYEPKEFLKLIDRWEAEMPKRIKTEIGKNTYPKALKDLREQINKNANEKI